MNGPKDIGEPEAPAFAEVAAGLGLGMAFQIRVSADGERRFTYVAPNCEAVTGLSAEVALADARAVYELILPAHRERFARAEAEALAGAEGRFEIEVEVQGAEGDVRWRRIASVRRRLPDGSSIWDGLLSDVGDARRAALELEERRRRLEAAIEAADLGFWEWDLRAKQLVLSQRNKALLGFAPDAPVTLEMYLATIHPGDEPLLRAAFCEAQERQGGGDFTVEYRAVAPNGQLRWMCTRGRIVWDHIGPCLAVGTTQDVTDRREAEEQRSLVMGELAHRAKNGIQVMMAIITETARSAGSVENLEQVVLARLQAMAYSQDLVTAAGGRPVQLGELAAQVLHPFGLSRIDIDQALSGLTVHGDAAAGLALLLHELATNAVKHGALSRPNGRIRIAAGNARPGVAALTWTERGGPKVEPPTRRGFGSKVLQAALRNHGGKVDSAFEPEGFSARMEFRIAG